MTFDVHSHLQLPEYDADRADVIARMKAAGVGTITVGVDYASSEAALALAEEYPDAIWASVGTHPADGDLDAFDEAALERQAAHKKAVAIGECGLDYYRPLADQNAVKKRQEDVFRAHIRVAERAGKTVMVHCRPRSGTDDAYDDLAAILEAERPRLKAIVIHFFVGSPAVAARLLAIGCHFTFGGVVTFARDYDAASARIPIDRMMAETDAPCVTPVPYRGTRNEPAYVVEVVRKLAELKGLDYEAFRARTGQTVRAVFGI